LHQNSHRIVSYLILDYKYMNLYTIKKSGNKKPIVLNRCMKIPQTHRKWIVRRKQFARRDRNYQGSSSRPCTNHITANGVDIIIASNFGTWICQMNEEISMRNQKICVCNVGNRGQSMRPATTLQKLSVLHVRPATSSWMLISGRIGDDISTHVNV
jgi:hypothetical protein